MNKFNSLKSKTKEHVSETIKIGDNYIKISIYLYRNSYINIEIKIINTDIYEELNRKEYKYAYPWISVPHYSNINYDFRNPIIKNVEQSTNELFNKITKIYKEEIDTLSKINNALGISET